MCGTLDSCTRTQGEAADTHTVTEKRGLADIWHSLLHDGHVEHTSETDPGSAHTACPCTQLDAVVLHCGDKSRQGTGHEER